MLSMASHTAQGAGSLLTGLRAAEPNKTRAWRGGVTVGLGAERAPDGDVCTVFCVETVFLPSRVLL